MSNRYWVFTIFPELSQEQLEGGLILNSTVKNPLWQTEEMTYMVYQMEQCPSSGLIHWQGCVGFKKTKRWKQVMQLVWNDLCFVEPSRSEACINYCKKKESAIDEAIELGKISSAGSRNDLLELRTKLIAGETIGTLWRDEKTFVTMMRNYRAVKEAALYLQPKAMRIPLEVTFIWGEPGTGKTYSAWQEYPDLFVPTKDWFDGYDGQETVLLDEFDKSDWKKVPMSWYLKLIDVYPFEVETKGGMLRCKAKRFFITSNVPLEQINITQEEQRSLRRRVTKEIHKQGFALPSIDEPDN